MPMTMLAFHHRDIAISVSVVAGWRHKSLMMILEQFGKMNRGSISEVRARNFLAALDSMEFRDLFDRLTGTLSGYLRRAFQLLYY